MEDSFTQDYDSLRTAMKNLGLSPNSGNFSKFSATVNKVTENVAARIHTQKALFRIGSKEHDSVLEENVYHDDFYQYQVWAEKNGNTITSISGGGTGHLDVSSIEKAVTEVINKIRA